MREGPCFCLSDAAGVIGCRQISDFSAKHQALGQDSGIPRSSARFDDRSGVSIALRPGSRTGADAVAVLDLDWRAAPTAVLALTLGLVADAAGADRRGLAVFAPSRPIDSHAFAPSIRANCAI